MHILEHEIEKNCWCLYIFQSKCWYRMYNNDIYTKSLIHWGHTNDIYINYTIGHQWNKRAIKMSWFLETYTHTSVRKNPTSSRCSQQQQRNDFFPGMVYITIKPFVQHNFGWTVRSNKGLPVVQWVRACAFW